MVSAKKIIKSTTESPKPSASRRSRGRAPSIYKPWDAVIVGIDPSTQAHGYSVFVDGCLIDSGSFIFYPSFAENIHRFIYNVVACQETDKPKVFVAEDWFGSIKVIKALSAERARWLQSMELWSMGRNAYWETVNVSTWNKAYGIIGKSKERKAMSIALAESIRGSKVLDDNESDAILIGAFACRWAELSKLGLKQVEGK